MFSHDEPKQNETQKLSKQIFNVAEKNKDFGNTRIFQKGRKPTFIFSFPSFGVCGEKADKEQGKALSPLSCENWADYFQFETQDASFHHNNSKNIPITDPQGEM